MTLKTDCLGVVPMSEEEVNELYVGNPQLLIIKKLCRSHERLRTELEGCEILLREAEHRNQRPPVVPVVVQSIAFAPQITLSMVTKPKLAPVTQ